MAAHRQLTCPACGTTGVVLLPRPHVSNSMLSDGKIVAQPLRKASCESCGHGFHQHPPSPHALRGLFDDNYSLGERDRAAETRRAEQYADVVCDVLRENGVSPPARLLEVGCGMGSLLADLSGRWQTEYSMGVEPSMRLVEASRENCPKDISIVQAFAEDFRSDDAGDFDLCLSVNVLEHSSSPLRFLTACRESVRSSGHVLIVCPDGEQPASELLFFDHLSSFSVSSLTAFAQLAGLGRLDSRVLDGPLRGFGIHLFGTDGAGHDAETPTRALANRRASYLNGWRNSAKRLQRVLGNRRFAIFGTGEFADLMAAYCPEVVAEATCFTADAPLSETYRGKALIDTDTALRMPDLAFVAAVNERHWPAISKRFDALGRDIYHPCISTPDMAIL